MRRPKIKIPEASSLASPEAWTRRLKPFRIPSFVEAIGKLREPLILIPELLPRSQLHTYTPNCRILLPNLPDLT